MRTSGRGCSRGLWRKDVSGRFSPGLGGVGSLGSWGCDGLPAAWLGFWGLRGHTGCDDEDGEDDGVDEVVVNEHGGKYDSEVWRVSEVRVEKNEVER